MYDDSSGFGHNGPKFSHFRSMLSSNTTATTNIDGMLKIKHFLKSNSASNN